MTAPFEDQIQIEYLRVPMRDGVELALKVTRPKDAGPFPAIMEYNPYRRQMKPRPDYRDEYPPAIPYLAERGYAMVQFDARGTGNSSGYSTDIYNDAEQLDACDVIDWICNQPWSTGKVGMLGKSFGAVVQWQVAVQRPKALKAILVRSANDDVYTEWVYPGGSLRPYMFDTYSATMNTYNFAPPDPDIVGDRWQEIWQERLHDNIPWGVGYLSHPLQGEYWQSKSLSKDYSRVECAAMVMAGWSDCYSTALLRAFENLQCPKKAFVGPWGHWYGEEPTAMPGPRIDTRPIYQRWFDYWLKDIDNGVMDEPPVTIFVRDYAPPSPRMPQVEPGSFRHETEWPIARTERTPFYLTDGALTDSPATDSCVDHFTFRPGAGVTSGIHWGGGVLPWGMPLDQRADEPHSLLYSSELLEQDTEVTGTAVAKLFVESTASIAYFRIKLVDVAPDGTAKLVRYGGLDATHRDSHDQPKRMSPGEVVEIDVELKTVSYVFQAGHRIRVMISGADFQNAWPTPEAGVHKIHTGGARPSSITLPIIPARPEPLPEPDLVYLPPADTSGLLRPAHHCVTEETALNQTSCRLHVISGSEADRLELDSTFTVNNDKPSDAVIEAWGRYHFKRSACDVEVFSDERTSSNESSFKHEVNVEVTLDGKPFFSKEFSVEVPRTL